MAELPFYVFASEAAAGEKKSAFGGPSSSGITINEPTCACHKTKEHWKGSMLFLSRGVGKEEVNNAPLPTSHEAPTKRAERAETEPFRPRFMPSTNAFHPDPRNMNELDEIWSRSPLEVILKSPLVDRRLFLQNDASYAKISSPGHRACSIILCCRHAFFPRFLCLWSVSQKATEVTERRMASRGPSTPCCMFHDVWYSIVGRQNRNDSIFVTNITCRLSSLRLSAG